MAKRPAKKAKQPPAQPAAEQLELPYIHHSLRALAVPLEQLVPDPANAKKHGPESIAAIAASLREYGQRKPIVVQRDGMKIRAGNGTYLGARDNGWTHLAAVVVDDDNMTAVGFAIADNRVAEVGSEWDREALTQLLREVEVADPVLQQMHEELAAELKLVLDETPAVESAEPAPVPPPDRYQVLINCRDEAQQKELLERLTQEGIECRALTV